MSPLQLNSHQWIPSDLNTNPNFALKALFYLACPLWGSPQGPSLPMFPSVRTAKDKEFSLRDKH